ncbi:hypothetical protein N1851_005138 [Merluccius polli]|uniref:Uncharacterized protein n=1 Tax=Merluccius polli TaxID=89951 RepID=A0AA47N7V6_MERPO|nr:hypothetical protein N1851_005138 [Merluccius polli]
MNTYLRRWLGVPRCFCSIGLYSTGSKLQLPVLYRPWSVAVEYNATKTRQVMMLRDSQDARVCQAYIEGKVGQGQPEGEACMVQWEVCKAEEERRRVKAVAMNKQGTWTRAGASATAETRSKGVLATAFDWEMWADLRKQLKFPEEITHTSLIADIVLWSKGTKQVASTYLFASVPLPYRKWLVANITKQAEVASWWIWIKQIEQWQSQPARKRLVANITKQAEAASWWIWMKWNEQGQSQPGLAVGWKGSAGHWDLTRGRGLGGLLKELTCKTDKISG